MPLNIFKSKNKASNPSEGDPDQQFQLERLYQSSPLLRKRPLTPVAPLDRDEVHTHTSDKGLLVGSFYHAYAVTRICLKERHDRQPLDGSQHDAAQTARQHLAETSSKEKKGYYSIKYISKKSIKRLQAADKKLLWQSRTNLLVEANYLAKFQHPHILELQGVSSETTTTEVSFLVTYRLAETLEDRLASWQAEHAKNPKLHAADPTCPSFATKLGYARDIASALHYLHERQIVVLGLSPSSIGFLAHSGRLQLVDLGTCRELAAFSPNNSGQQQEPVDGGAEPEDDLKFDDDEIGDGERFVQTANSEGTATDALLVPMTKTGVIPRYIAPEVVTQGVGSVSPKADVYSWAMICVEMITLQKAFSHYLWGQYMVKVCMEGKRPNLSTYPNLPQSMDGVLKRGWRHSKGKRWDSSQILEGIEKIIEKHIKPSPAQQEQVAPPKPRLSRSMSVPKDVNSSVPMDISLMQQSMIEHTSSRRDAKSNPQQPAALPAPLLARASSVPIADDSLLSEESSRRRDSDELRRKGHRSSARSGMATTKAMSMSMCDLASTRKPSEGFARSDMATTKALSLRNVTSTTRKPSEGFASTYSSVSKREKSSPSRSPSRGSPVRRAQSDGKVLQAMAGKKRTDTTNKKSKLPHRTKSGDSTTKSAATATTRASDAFVEPQGTKKSRLSSRTRSGDSTTKASVAVATRTSDVSAVITCMGENQSQRTSGTESLEWSTSQLSATIESNRNRQSTGDAAADEEKNPAAELSASFSSLGKKPTKRSNKEPAAELSASFSSLGKKPTKRSSKEPAAELSASLSSLGKKPTKRSNKESAAELSASFSSLGNKPTKRSSKEPAAELSASFSSLGKKSTKRISKGTRKKERRTSIKGSEKHVDASMAPEEGIKRSSKDSKEMRKTTSGELKRKKKSSQRRRSPSLGGNGDDIDDLVTAATRKKNAFADCPKSPAKLAHQQLPYARSDTLDAKPPRSRSISVDMDASKSKVESEPHRRSEKQLPMKTRSPDNTFKGQGKSPRSPRKTKEKASETKRPTIIRATSLRAFGSR